MTIYYGLVDPFSITYDDLVRIAAQRSALHANHQSQRKLSPNYELIGLVGEWTFAKWARLPLNLAIRPAGDGHVDFTHRIGTIDVKTYVNAINLPREINKAHSKILVLAAWNINIAPNDARLLGWEWDSVMLQCPTRDFGYGIINHYKSWALLQRMNSLKEMLESHA